MGVEDKKTSGDKEVILRFGLLLYKTIKGNRAEFRMSSKNQGIPDAEVVLLVEAWAQKVKEKIQKPIRDSLGFKKD